MTFHTTTYLVQYLDFTNYTLLPDLVISHLREATAMYSMFSVQRTLNLSV